MRRLLLPLILLCCFNTLKAQEIINAFLGKDQFPDKYFQVNKIVESAGWEYKINRKGIADSTLLGKYKFTYNADGQIIEENFFDAKDALISKDEYTYNVLGSVIQKRVNNYAKEIIYPFLPLKVYKYTYDSVGRISTKESYNGETMLMNTDQREYDEKGNLVLIRHKPYNGPAFVLNEATFDDNHNITNIDYLYLEHKLEYSRSFTTETTGAGDKVIKIDKDGEPDCIYTFNKYEQFIEWTSYQKEGFSKITYIEKITYNHDGTPYSYTRFSNGKLNRMLKFYYQK
jgi:hypothetical protein